MIGAPPVNKVFYLEDPEVAGLSLAEADDIRLVAAGLVVLYSVCVCVCACVRACVRVCVFAYA